MTHAKEIEEILEWYEPFLSGEYPWPEYANPEELPRAKVEAIKAMHEENKKLKERIAELEKADEWQPAETALKDGKPFLIKGAEMIGEISFGCSNAFAIVKWTGEYYAVESTDYYEVRVISFEAWKSLPTPPQERENGKN